MGYAPDLMSYNNIIWCCGNARRVEIAKKYFAKLVNNSNLRPNVYSYGALMHAYAKAKRAAQALSLLDEMKLKDILPNHVVFTSGNHPTSCRSEMIEIL